MTEDTGKIAYDYFTVRFHTPCADLTVSITTDLPDVTYLVRTGGPSASYTPNFSLANDDSCVLTTTYAIRELGSAAWWEFDDTISGDSAPYDFNDWMSSSGTYTVDVAYTTAATFNPARTFEVSIRRWAASSVAINASATEIFLLTMKDACLDNEITCDGAAVDFTHTIPAGLSATTTAVASSACTQAVAGQDSSGYCSFVSSLEIWTEATDSWNTYTVGATATWPWIKENAGTGAFSTSNSARMVSVDTLDSTTYVSPVTYKLRWKAVDTTSTHVNGLVYDDFDITIQYGCTQDTVALTNGGAGRSEWLYTLGATSGNNFAKTTTHSSGCPFTMVCEYYDTNAQTWTAWTDPPIKHCDVSNGVTFELQSTDTSGGAGAMTNYATYQPEKDVSMRIVYTSTSSNLADDDGRVAIDYFNVHFREACWNLSIVLTAGFNDVDYRVHAASAAENYEGTYSITNNNSGSTCSVTRTAYAKP